MATRYADAMERLIEELRKLPGVGTKSAQRFAFHLLRAPSGDAQALSEAILRLRAKLRLCSLCNHITETDPCAFCSHPARNPHLICAVEEPTSINAIEKTGSFNGLYHVLHGTISPVNGVGPEHLRLANLWPRLEGAEELILATSPTMEGEATAHYIADEARKRYPLLHISRIATGVPAGSDIEYADQVTMTRALEGRRAME
ncbi:MAG: recombination mediator RecR [Acidobacteriota bacterium]